MHHLTYTPRDIDPSPSARGGEPNEGRWGGGLIFSGSWMQATFIFGGSWIWAGRVLGPGLGVWSGLGVWAFGQAEYLGPDWVFGQGSTIGCCLDTVNNCISFLINGKLVLRSPRP